MNGVNKMKICIIGTGYVGLVTGTCLADFGLSVTCIDQDEQKINMLNSGGVPIYEPNLEALIKKNVSAGRLIFTTDLGKAVKQSKVIFIAVGTPSNDDGSANLKQIERVAQQIAASMDEYKVIVNKSTVPIGTATKIKEIINKNQNVTARSEVSLPQRKQGKQSHLSLRATEGSAAIPSSVIPNSSSVIPAKAGIHPSSPSPLRGEGGVRVKSSSVIARSEATRQSQPTSKPFDFDVVSNPEFLREGSAIYDFTHPDKIVIGTTSEKALKIMQEIYRPLYLIDTPFVITNPETAELIKYACNAFLATKITFINEIANLCDKVGADVHQIAKALGLDGRISPKFLHPGPGYGGSCFPKDTEALYGNLEGKTIGILGLAFKQNTDDIRESASIDIIKLLLKEGAKIKCFDPLAMDNTKKIFPDITYCENEYEVAEGSDCLVIATEWNQFRNLDLLRIKKLLKIPVLLDLRNLYEPEKVKSLGFIYEGIGRN
jgi:UDPglucose 6-dehydrogenase